MNISIPPFLLPLGLLLSCGPGFSPTLVDSGISDKEVSGDDEESSAPSELESTGGEDENSESGGTESGGTEAGDTESGGDETGGELEPDGDTADVDLETGGDEGDSSAGSGGEGSGVGSGTSGSTSGPDDGATGGGTGGGAVGGGSTGGGTTGGGAADGGSTGGGSTGGGPTGGGTMGGGAAGGGTGGGAMGGGPTGGGAMGGGTMGGGAAGGGTGGGTMGGGTMGGGSTGGGTMGGGTMGGGTIGGETTGGMDGDATGGDGFEPPGDDPDDADPVDDPTGGDPIEDTDPGLLDDTGLWEDSDLPEDSDPPEDSDLPDDPATDLDGGVVEPVIGGDCITDASFAEYAGSAGSYDCSLTCVPVDILDAWLGDGYCDDGTHLYDGYPVSVNLYCDHWELDRGDCDSETPDPDGAEEEPEEDGACDESPPDRTRPCDELNLVLYSYLVDTQNVVVEAATKLGMTTTTVTRPGRLRNAVRSDSPDIILLSEPMDRIPEAVVTAFDEQVCAGRFAISSYWDTDDNPALQAALGVTVTGDIYGAGPPYVHGASAPMWSTPFVLPAIMRNSVYSLPVPDHGEVFSAEGVEVVATADAAATEPIIVAGRGGRTIANGILFVDFLYDALSDTSATTMDIDGDGTTDLLELMTNELAYFCEPASDVGEVLLGPPEDTDIPLPDTGTPGADVDEGAMPDTGGPGEGSTDESDPAWDTAIPDDFIDGIDAVDEGDEADLEDEIDTGSSPVD